MLRREPLTIEHLALRLVFVSNFSFDTTHDNMLEAQAPLGKYERLSCF